MKLVIWAIELDIDLPSVTALIDITVKGYGDKGAAQYTCSVVL
jgi:hypothetical protein